MKAGIPIYSFITVGDPKQAVEVKEKLAKLFEQPMILQMIRAQGIPIDSVVVADPYPVPDNFIAAPTGTPPKRG